MFVSVPKTANLAIKFSGQEINFWESIFWNITINMWMKLMYFWKSILYTCTKRMWPKFMLSRQNHLQKFSLKVLLFWVINGLNGFTHCVAISQYALMSEGGWQQFTTWKIAKSKFFPGCGPRALSVFLLLSLLPFFTFLQ